MLAIFFGCILILQTSQFLDNLEYETTTGISIGPHTVRVERTAYNEAVTETQEEELLLNLIRTRYLRSLAFLQVASISSAIGVSASAGAEINVENSIPGSVAIAGPSPSPIPRRCTTCTSNRS